MKDVGESLSEQTKENKDRDLIEKFKTIELLKPFFEEKVSLELNLNQTLLQGIDRGLHEQAETEREQFSLLINRLGEAHGTPSQGKVNIVQCQVETEIIGYLIGRKVAKNSEDYAPEDIASSHTLPLRSLNRVARHASRAFHGKSESPQKLPKVESESQRE